MPCITFHGIVRPMHFIPSGELCTVFTGYDNDEGLQPKTINEMLKIQSAFLLTRKNIYGVIKDWDWVCC